MEIHLLFGKSIICPLRSSPLQKTLKYQVIILNNLRYEKEALIMETGQLGGLKAISCDEEISQYYRELIEIQPNTKLVEFAFKTHPTQRFTSISSSLLSLNLII